MKHPAVFSMCLTVAALGASAERPRILPNVLEENIHTVAIPGKSWSVEISLPSSFTVEEPEISSDGERAKLAGSNPSTGLQLSLFLEKAAAEGDAKVAREYYWKRMQASPLKMEEVQFSERGGAAVLEYTVKEASQKKIDWKNMNLYLSHDGYWVDVHLSKILFRSTDQDSFDKILDSVKISSSQPDSKADVEASKPYSVSLPRHGKLILNIPASWKRSVRKAPGDLPPTIILSPKKGDAFETMITPLWSPKNDPNFNKTPALKLALEQILRTMLPSAVEKEVPIQEFSGIDGPGYYFLVTDKAPKPGEYPYAVGAIVGVGDLVLGVSILCRDKESEGIGTTIRILQEARQEKDQ
ncbi:MAG: hypothetical protein WCC00_11360 [Candidatus Aminicenantales bacterium]